ncbi:PepSY-associated TM helix domain-containing protein [Amycolatopsis cihanbeyliensis]|uniref:Putative iron-regulated membrane protein n=1 Tax=Amycolatopsis cihanbeyliensis TaxID=1128664 RepID=A0A542DHJ3_AMYCI|nr:putative iron-regulated membrane protein [Amycolatopsis cihanbeyliensis]
MPVSEREAGQSPAGDPVRPGTGWAALRPFALRLHFYAGVFVAPFLLVAAVTGLLYVFTPQLEDAVYDHELHVPATRGELPLAEQVDQARMTVPDGRVTAVRPAPTPTDTTQVIFDRAGLEPSFHHTVFVNPHNGELRGSLETYGSGQALPLRTWFDQLHRNLHLGDPGRIYTELAASWLWVIVLGGLVLWLGRRRRERRLRRTLLPEGGGPGRKRLLSWHGAVGLWSALGLLFLSATGLTWSLFAGVNIGDLRAELDWTTPSVATDVAQLDGPDVGIDAVRATTAAAGLSDPVEIRPSAGPGDAYVVQQIQRHWPEKQDSMAVDPATGRITDTLRFEDYSLGAKLARWGIDAHMGFLFGWVNQLALLLLAGGLICLIVWGYRMWWRRRPPGGRLGRPPPRGAWRRVPARVLAPLLVAAAVIGWFLPVFGVSLLLFVLVDLALGARAARAGAAGAR